MNDCMQIVLSKQGLKLVLFCSDEKLVAGLCEHYKLQLSSINNGNSRQGEILVASD
jgi:hypothetical protein